MHVRLPFPLLPAFLLAACSLEIHEAAAPVDDDADLPAEASGDAADAGDVGDSSGDAEADPDAPPDVVCPGELTFCGTVCVDLATHAENCGRCFLLCGARGDCIGGQCQCPRDTALCPEGCIPVARDPLNCGGCGNVCPAGTRCREGVCG